MRRFQIQAVPACMVVVRIVLADRLGPEPDEADEGAGGLTAPFTP